MTQYRNRRCDDGWMGCMCATFGKNVENHFMNLPPISFIYPYDDATI